MGSALVVAVVKYGLLGLLWVFVLLAVRTMTADLRGGRRAPAIPTPTAVKPAKRRKGIPRTLVVTAGGLQGATVTLTGSPVTLGRADDSTLVLTDDYASNRHARLVPLDAEGTQWQVEDLGSTNGTYLDGVKVTRPTAVRVGVPISIGKTVMELRA